MHNPRTGGYETMDVGRDRLRLRDEAGAASSSRFCRYLPPTPCLCKAQRTQASNSSAENGLKR
jgi:hypothetical protein